MKLLPVCEWSPSGPEEGSCVLPVPIFHCTRFPRTGTHSHKPLSKLHVRPATANDKYITYGSRRRDACMYVYMA